MKMKKKTCGQQKFCQYVNIVILKFIPYKVRFQNNPRKYPPKIIPQILTDNLLSILGKNDITFF